MSFAALSQWFASSRRRRSAKARKAVRPNPARLHVEELETRTLLSVLPVVQVTGQVDISGSEGNENTPSVSVDPTNSQKLVSVYTRNDPALGAFPPTQNVLVQGNYSTDGGQNWFSFSIPGNIIDPNTLTQKPPVVYQMATNATVGFDRSGSFYIFYSEHTADNTSGTLMLQKYDFSTGAPTPTISDKIIYQWITNNAALNPTLTVDSNPATFTDPTTSVVQTDPYAGNVYLAYNVVLKPPGNNTTPPPTFNPDVIYVQSSADGGNSFTNLTFGNANGFFGLERDARPQLTVSEGTADGRVSPGQLTLTWNDFAVNHGNIVTNRIANGGTAEVYNGMGGVVATAGSGTPNVPVTTSFTQTVDFTGDPKFSTLTSLDVTMAFNAASGLADKKVVLEADLPSGKYFITLFSNGTDAAGKSTGIGITGTGLGVVNGDDMGATFDVNADRAINDPGATSPFLGLFRPEEDPIGLPPSPNLDVFKGFKASDLKGTWILEITDFRNSTTIDTLDSWSLNFTGGMSLSKDVTVATTSSVAGAAGNPLAGSINSTYPDKLPVSPDLGVGPTPVLTSDNTLGSFSPYQGRLYLAYVGDTGRLTAAGASPGIWLLTSDDGGSTWTSRGLVNDDNVTDGFSEGTRAQFAPAIAVDQATGTFVATWYDARYDASNARVARFITTSIDGGSSFSKQTWLNATKTATDAITGQSVTLEPIPDNQNFSGRDQTFGFGDRQGLAVSQGNVYATWAGNFNGNNPFNSANPQTLDILTAKAVFAAGPRIIASTQGPVQPTTVDGTTFNNVFNADGVNEVTGFTITFDRPVDDNPADAGAPNPSDFTVFYHDTVTPASNPGTQVSVASVTPLDDGSFGPAKAKGATTFLVTFTTPQSGIGTYSYSVSPTISDRIRGILTVVGSVGSPVTYTSSDVPKSIPDVGSAFSTVAVSGIPAGQVLAGITVTLDVTHTYDADLVMTLIAPNGSTILLTKNRGGSGQNYTATTFDDSASTPIGKGSAPFTGSFRPEQPLSALRGIDPTGTWTLEIDDTQVLDTGTLNSWSLTISTGTVTVGTVPGNQMDQDANGISGENPGDVYSAPRSLSGTPFQLPYDQNTLPMIVPGPHVASTSVPGQPVTSDNLVLNAKATAFDVTFDRDMNPASITPASVLRMVGPLGTIAGPFTITANPNGTDPDPAHPRTYRIGFPAVALSGTYTIVLASSITDEFSNALDTNENAGVAVLNGVDPTSTVTQSITYDTGTLTTSLPPGKTIISTINVPDSYLVEGATLRLNITDPNDPDLVASLVAPDGTTIKLFTNVGGNASPRANFINTIFDDNANTPIQQGVPPFNNGPFNPQTPLSTFLGHGSLGAWKLVITNVSTTNTGTLTEWALTLKEKVPTSGMGEPVADQATVHFRIFNYVTNNSLAATEWTPIGPASINGNGNSGRITGLAVDPSDPSGNTVYVGGASGGIWKTTNFLTNDPNGPTYIPLTDFGPTTDINIGGIAVFGRNSNPNQSIIIAGTGEGDTGTTGVGFLLSLDGGSTWQLIDSTTNVDSLGNPLPITSKLRDHLFVGSTTFKVIVDPNLTSSGGVIVYAAIQSSKAGVSGIWRSMDGGEHWADTGGNAKPLRAGKATDVILAPDSGSGATNNLQIVYGAFEGDGVYLSPDQGATWQLMAGGVGDPLIQDADKFNTPPIPVNNLGQTPNGANGRIDLVTPFLTGNPAQDKIYEGWVYALVASASGGTTGLFLTKDFGQNWTQVHLPILVVTAASGAASGFPSNNETRPDYSPLGSAIANQGNYNISLAIDPTNPNVVYVGGTADFQPTGTSLIRVDTTGIKDPHALYAYDESDASGGNIETATTGGAALKKNALYGLLDAPGAYLNVIRDPLAPFLSNSTLLVTNVASFTNDGTNITSWTPFGDAVNGTTDQHRVISMLDPLTGHARLIFADDQGIFSAVDNGDGTFNSGIGTALEPSNSRNGNLQITQFYYGAAQPSTLAAQIAGAMFYGNAQDDGFPVSDPNILTNGNIQWSGPGGDGTGIATDQTGSGTVYTYQWPCCNAIGVATDFFGVGTAPNSPYVSRTFGLLQAGDHPGFPSTGQWPFETGSNFAVDPLDGNQIIMSSQAGRIFRTQDQGKTWFDIGDPANLDSTYAPATAYGAPDPGVSAGNLDNYLFAGTVGGHIFVTFTGGGNGTGNGWINLSSGLDGSSVGAIYTNPLRGSHEAWAVTRNGVYYMQDSTAVGAKWQNITGNLFQLQQNAFGNVNLAQPKLQYLTSIVADYRFVFLDNPKDPTKSHPILYVAGQGGVFRSTDKGKTWTIFPDVVHNGASQDGSILPNALVSNLQLSLGNIDPATGRPDQSTADATLLATTYGRGEFAIHLQAPTAVADFPLSGHGINSQIPSIEGLAWGGILAVFSDTDPNGSNGSYSAVINWADGTSSNGAILPQPDGTYLVAASHVYAEEASYGITVTITDTDISHDAGGASISAVLLAQIGDAPVAAVGNSLSVGANFIVSNQPIATIIDAAGALEADSQYTALINWGDGTGQIPGGISAGVVYGSHVYSTPGNYQPIVTIIDSGGAVGTGTASVIVGNQIQRFVAQVYRDLLGRLVDPSGLSTWINFLQSGGTHSQFVADVENSTEYRQDEVANLYLQLLHRPVDEGGLATWTNYLNSGGNVRGLEAKLLATDEYFANRGKGNDTGFLNAVYLDVLNRPIDNGGLSTYLGLLLKGASREQVATDILTSTEAFQDETAALYLKYLRRPVDPSGLSSFVGGFEHGLTIEAAINSLLSSDEYYAMF
jgi:subtilisin-like proprotein convertase family protein